MKIAVLGTGMVGNALATKLANAGHQVMMGSRTANSKPAQEWQNAVGKGAQIGTFADAAAFGELIISCTNSVNSVAALRQAGEANLRGTEMYLALWIRLWGKLGTPHFNIRLVRG